MYLNYYEHLLDKIQTLKHVYPHRSKDIDYWKKEVEEKLENLRKNKSKNRMISCRPKKYPKEKFLT